MMSAMVLLQALSAAVLAWLAVEVIRSDFTEQKVRNRHLAAALAACAAGYLLQASLTVAGVMGAVQNWLLARFYLMSLRHGLISLAAGVALWLLDVWPAGDAKLFVVCAVFLPLIQPHLRAFPNYLFLQLLSNIFVVAALFLAVRSLADALRAFWRTPAVVAARSLSAARAWIPALVDGSLRWSAWLPALATTTVLFLLFGILRQEAALHAAALAVQPALLGVVLMMGWERAGGWLRDVRIGAGSAAFGAAALGLVAWRDPVRSWELLRTTAFQVSVFSLVLMAARMALERHLQARAMGRVGLDDLRPGMILSDETVALLRRDRAFFQEHLTPLRRDGLTVDQVSRAREWFLGLPADQRTIAINRGYPFASWIFVGTLFTLLMTRDAASLLISLRPTPEAMTSVQKQRKYLFDDIRAPFFALDRRTGEYSPQRPGADPSRFSASKLPDRFRVFVVGGSVARRYMEGFARLRSALEEALPGRNVEIIDCGMPAYDSFREALLFDEIPKYSPDLIVLFSGHNEFLDLPPPVPSFWPLADYSRYWRRRLLMSRESYPEKVSRRDADFQNNLRTMLRQAGDREVPVAVVLPPLNYRDSLAPHPEVRSAPEGGPGFYAGWVRYLRGEYRLAADEWRHEADIAARGFQPARRAQALFFLSRAYEKLGRSAEADSSAVGSVNTDLLALRNTPKRLEAMREIAMQEGAIVVDADRVFRDIAAPRLPGLDMFTDALHWQHRYDPDITFAILRALLRAPRLKALGWSERYPRAHPAAPHASVDAAPDEEEALQTLRYAVSYLDKPDSQPSWPAVFYLGSVYDRYPGWFQDVPSLARRVEGSEGRGEAWGMAALHAALPQLYWHVAEIQLLHGRYFPAIAGFRRALELDANQPRLLLGLGIASALAGDARGGREALDRAKERGLAAESDAIARALGGRR